MAFCQQCGKELSEGAKFCMECGAAVEIKSASDMDEAQAREAAEVINELSAEAAGETKEAAGPAEPVIVTVEEPRMAEPVKAAEEKKDGAVPEHSAAAGQQQGAPNASASQNRQSAYQTQNTQYTPSQNGGANNQNQYQYQQQGYDPRKSRTLAGILGILFGCFGVHNFYLGYTSKAVIQLCVSIVGLLLSCFVIGTFIVIGIAIWGLVEGIMILAGSINVDAKGVPLKD